MTAGWRPDFTPRAIRDPRQIDPPTQDRILAALDRLAGDPPVGDTRKLDGYSDQWRLRVGDWRVRYRRNHGARIIVVLGIRHRREIYRG